MLEPLRLLIEIDQQYLLYNHKFHFVVTFNTLTNTSTILAIMIHLYSAVQIYRLIIVKKKKII